MRSRPRVAALLVAAWPLACGGPREGPERVGDLVLPPSDDMIVSVEPGATAEDLLPIVDAGLQTPRKGPDFVRFVVIRAGDRHGTNYRAEEFHVVVGAGVALPDGAMRIARSWGRPGMVDGQNEPPQTYGLAVAVEPGAARPFSAAVVEATQAFCGALGRRIPIHPDCVLAMQEIPRTHVHAADPDERALAAAARAAVPIPPADRTVTIRSGGRALEVACEYRNTTAGRQVGLMMRRAFDGTDRGMLFEYDHRAYRYFWMFNCKMPIDLAYIRDGKVEQIVHMKAESDTPLDRLPRYASDAAVRFVLEMPSGWFEQRGVEVGDPIDLGG